MKPAQTITFMRYHQPHHPRSKEPLPMNVRYYAVPGGDISTAENILNWSRFSGYQIVLSNGDIKDE